ncbi:MAG: hypothetical protein WAL91_11895 [Propionicimonas sp.]
MPPNSSRLISVLVGVLLVVGITPAVPAAADSAARSEHQRIVDFWTKDRVAQAKPRDFVRDRVTGELSPAPTATTTSVLGRSWDGGGAVQKTTGKVLFAIGRSYYVCSASVVNDTVTTRSIVLTAGHCAYDNKTAKFATNWMFVPDYDSNAVDLTTNGSFCAQTTYGCWTASALVVHQGFASQRKFSTQATLYDFAFAVVYAGGKSMKQLDDTVGSQEVSFDPASTGFDTYLFGYPAAAPYTGKDLVYSEGALGTDPLNSNKTYRVASDMTGGCSGGPWFSGFTSGGGTLISVNSYGYNGITAMHGPMFNTKTQALYGRAATATANTIVGP